MMNLPELEPLWSYVFNAYSDEIVYGLPYMGLNGSKGKKKSEPNESPDASLVSTPYDLNVLLNSKAESTVFL